MNEGRTVFAQLLDCLSKYEFDRCVHRYRGNFRVRKLTAYDQFVVMAFARLHHCRWQIELPDTQIQPCLPGLLTEQWDPRLIHPVYNELQSIQHSSKEKISLVDRLKFPRLQPMTFGMKKILLIVGLITVLVGAGWVVSAYRTWRVNARMNKLNDDVENLFGALQKFKEHVGSYPIGGNAEVAKALKGQNAKNVIILVGRKNELNDKGEFVDPWGTPLRIYFSDIGILVRSAGSNKRFDDSTTMECDDYFRSN